MSAYGEDILPEGRENRTPHSGYHFDGTSRRFFEGWYFKISIPEIKQSFAWMYSIEDPATGVDSSFVENFFSGLPEKKFPGSGAQILGADEEYLFQYDKDVNSFWASKNELALGHTFRKKGSKEIPKGPLTSEAFSETVLEGYQVTPTWHQGSLVDNKSSPNVTTVPSASWQYSTRPVYGWGGVGKGQKATAGWLAAFPVFEPHWQICMGGGVSEGWVQWGDKKYHFKDAPSYCEKNWGGSFPKKWFWIQCNVFEGVEGEMALTAGGGRRGLPLLPNLEEEVAMVGVHYKGVFYEFVPWGGEVIWKISPWGKWEMEAYNDEFEVELRASTDSQGTVLRAPTKDFGLSPFCRDSFFGTLEISIWERTRSGRRGKLVVSSSSSLPALEVGGGPWWDTWQNSSKISDPQKVFLGLPVDLGSLLPPEILPPGI